MVAMLVGALSPNCMRFNDALGNLMPLRPIKLVGLCSRAAVESLCSSAVGDCCWSNISLQYFGDGAELIVLAGSFNVCMVLKNDFNDADVDGDCEFGWRYCSCDADDSNGNWCGEFVFGIVLLNKTSGIVLRFSILYIPFKTNKMERKRGKTQKKTYLLLLLLLCGFGRLRFCFWMKVVWNKIHALTSIQTQIDCFVAWNAKKSPVYLNIFESVFREVRQ